jgi:GNAT superfamily N-acetyltransferase
VFVLRPARPDEVSTVIALLEDAARWLRTKGTDQWQRPWPDDEGRTERVRASVAARRTWLLCAGGRAAGTVSMDEDPDGRLWTPWECREPAAYVRRLAVRRDLRGRRLGAELLNWAGSRAALLGAHWVRVDVWTTNRALHAYYLRQGFEHVRTRNLPDYPSGALFQRAALLRETPRLCS